MLTTGIAIVYACIHIPMSLKVRGQTIITMSSLMVFCILLVK